MKTLLIDGSNLSMIHFAANPATDANGAPIGMVKGFLNSITWISSTLKPNKVIIFFDGSGGSLQRRQFAKDYKSGRRPMNFVGARYSFSSQEQLEKNKDYQFNVLLSLLERLPVLVIKTNNFESDDGIAYCTKYSDYFKLGKIFIVSCDKDFYQLIGENVSVYNPQSKKIYTQKEVVEEWGIHPNNWLFYRSITGDSSDNIKGVEGIGPKTALKIFDLQSCDIEYTPEDIDIIYETKDQITNKSAQNNLEKIYKNKQSIEDNYKLMNLNNPMMSSESKNIVEGAILNFKPKFKKFEFLREVATIPLPFDYYSVRYYSNLLE